MIVLTITIQLLLQVQTISGIHQDLSTLQLQHVFGTKNANKVPSYWLDKPSRRESSGGFHYDVVIDGQMETFWLEPKKSIIAQDFHIVTRDEKNSSINIMPDHHNCLYQGESVSHNGSSIALTGCDDEMRGLVVGADGHFYLIQPHSNKHVIQKRSAGFDHDQHTCLFDAEKDPYPEDREEMAMRSVLMKFVREPRMTQSRIHGVMTIELAVFADDALWRHFYEMHGNRADEELHKFILAAVNNIDILYTQRGIQPRISIRVVRYEVMKTAPANLVSWRHSKGDVDRLLDAFCIYQHEINPPRDDDPRHWDHALLFSGYDLYRGNLKTVAGYAPVKGMCSGIRSCTINEGLDFGSVFVVTHEMGHSLGMYHDGDNACDLGCCIMSPSVGSGKTKWSSCSVREMSHFVGNLGASYRPPNCLRDLPIEESDMVFKDKDNPGQIFTLDEQCEIFHGECWKHELKDGQVLQDVCSMVWCGNGEGVIRTAHPALEGSYCGHNKQCRSGVCAYSYSTLRQTSGGWSPWNDRPSAGCGGGCTACSIQGQIRVRRSIRQCNRPSANNGGQWCSGDEARGLRCSSAVCTGVSPEQHATRVCTKLRDRREVENGLLTGEGIQFDQAPCKIWCLMENTNNIRTVSNFPDGTPCGSGKYCIKGECRPLLCKGSTITLWTVDCPSSAHPPRPKQENSVNREPYWRQWTGWSEWSTCIAYKCDARGVRVRVRSCIKGDCNGSARQRNQCVRRCADERPFVPQPTAPQRQITVVRTAPRITTTPMPRVAYKQMYYKNRDYSPWSGCSVSCGQGMKVRRRKNCFRGKDCREFERCDKPACTSSSSSRHGTWTGWSLWSVCSKTCGTGVQTRKRACNHGVCVGNDSQGKRCNLASCERSSGRWTAWSDWSNCSVSCGRGRMFRTRACSRGGVCNGRTSESVICNMPACRRTRGIPENLTQSADGITQSTPHYNSGATSN